MERRDAFARIDRVFITTEIIGRFNVRCVCNNSRLAKRKVKASKSHVHYPNDPG